MSAPSRNPSYTRTYRNGITSDGKDMSWRKPVPKYIPSPPPSPQPSSPSFPPLSVSLGAAMSDETPPLPTHWRETIERALGNDVARPKTCVVDTGVSLPSSPEGGRVYSIPPIVVTDDEHFEEVDLGTVRRRDENMLEMRQIGLVNRPMSAAPGFQSTPPLSALRPPTSYRPPTPPLRSNTKRSRRSDSAMSCLVKPGELVYPDLVGLGETDSNRIAPTSSECSFAPPCSRTNIARHTLPPSLVSWLSQKPGSIDSATLVDEELSLPTYHRKPSTDSMTVAINLSRSAGVWETVKSWTELIVSKVKDFGASAVSFWSSRFF